MSWLGGVSLKVELAKNECFPYLRSLIEDILLRIDLFFIFIFSFLAMYFTLLYNPFHFGLFCWHRD